jgi:hypothetical protein
MKQIAYGLADCCWMIVIVWLGAMLTLMVGA